MQPIHYGAPIYPNCFDLLTTHGVVADDVVGYITDQPSPYLQNYVTQRGWPPSVPGQILPDTLPAAQTAQKLPRNDVYQTVTTEQQHIPNSVPTQDQINDFVKQPHHENWKKIATGLLIGGLTAFGLYKIGAGIKALKRTTGHSGSPWYQRLGNSLKSAARTAGNTLKKAFSSLGDFFKNLWTKIKP